MAQMTKSNKSKKSNKSNYSNKSNSVARGAMDKETRLNEPTPENTNRPPITVTFITSITEPTSIADKVRFFLYEHPKSTLTEISKQIEIDRDKVKTIVIQQNKDLFESVGKIGKEFQFSLTSGAKAEIDMLIENKHQQIQREEKAEKEKEEKKKQDAEAKEKIKTVLSTFDGFYSIKNNGVVCIDARKLQEQELNLFQQLEEKPESTLSMIEASFNELGLVENARVRFENLDVYSRKTIESLRSKDLDSLISIDGKIRSLTNIRPQVVNAMFECPSCGAILNILQTDKKFIEPSRCSCGWKGKFQLLSKEMIDVARIVLEDLDITNSYDKKSLQVYIKEDLVSQEEFSKFNPGNEVRVLGILKEIPTLLPSGAISTKFDWAFETVSVEELDPETQLETLSPETINKFKEICGKIEEEGIKVLTSSIAPEVFGYDYIKEAIAIQSAQTKNNPSKEVRTKSNILLIGDPGVSKSVLCKFARKINYGCTMGSCGSATSVGITATVEKDDYGWIVKPGLYPLARDLCILEEFNLMSDEDKPKLQEAMSEMQININKASIHTTIPVRAGVLANANPQSGEFNEYQDIIKQFNLYPPIKNRFDLIFPIKDENNFERDKEISKIMLRRQQGKISAEYSAPFLRDFFLFVRSQPEPIFSEELLEFIPEFYAERRKLSKEINARFQETLERLCKGCAKLRLSNICEKKDLERAIAIIKHSHQFLNIGYRDKIALEVQQ